MESKDKTKKCSSISEAKLTSKVNMEEITDDALVESIMAELKSQSGLFHDEDGQLDITKNDVTESSEQSNEDLVDKTKDKVTNEINKTIATGFSRPDFFIEKLKKLCKYCYLELSFLFLTIADKQYLIKYFHRI
jgi:hypothetical protein